MHIKGNLFHGQNEASICFVPSSCILLNTIPELDREAYIKGNWHILNLKLNPHGVGGHLFPTIPLEEVPGKQVSFLAKLKGLGYVVERETLASLGMDI